MPRVDGVDVSKWQGSINWSALVLGTGIKFASARVWDRDTGAIDATFQANRLGMAFSGVRYRFLAWYLEPGRSPVEQASQCFSIVGPLAAGEAIGLDAESTSTAAQAEQFKARIVQLYGNRMGCYTANFVDGGKTWRSTKLYDGSVPRWWAAPIDEAAARARATPYAWDLWQWGQGPLPGIIGPVDLNQLDNPDALERVCYPEGNTMAGIDQNDANLIAKTNWDKGLPFPGYPNGYPAGSMVSDIRQVLGQVQNELLDKDHGLAALGAKLDKVQTTLDDFAAATGLDPTELAKKLDAAIAGVVNRTTLKA